MRNADIIPTYKRVQKAKLLLRPQGITATEALPEVPLQNLLDCKSDCAYAR